MPESFAKVCTVFDCQSHQRELEVWIHLADCLQSRKVRLHLLCTAPDSAQWAEQVLIAELGSMEPDFLDLEEVPKVEIVAAVGQVQSQLDFALLSGIISHQQRPVMCL
jgi:hypothetical protein